MPDSDASRRWASCSPDISMVKMATRAFCPTAAFRAKFRSSADLPTLGRAAQITRSERWKPPSSVSRSMKPVRIEPIAPANGESMPGVSQNCSSSVRSGTRSLMRCDCRSVMIRFSARPIAPSRSGPPWYATCTICEPAVIIARYVASRLTMCA